MSRSTIRRSVLAQQPQACLRWFQHVVVTTAPTQCKEFRGAGRGEQGGPRTHAGAFAAFDVGPTIDESRI